MHICLVLSQHAMLALSRDSRADRTKVKPSTKPPYR